MSRRAATITKAAIVRAIRAARAEYGTAARVTLVVEPGYSIQIDRKADADAPPLAPKREIVL